MADNFSSNLRVRLQATGANRNTWGALVNAAALQLLEDAIAGAAPITIAGSDVTLTQVNGASDQSRKAILVLQGAPGTSRNVIVPAITKLFVVINNTGFDQTVKTASGSGVTVPDGARQFLLCDGTNVVAAQANNLGTVANSELLDGLDSSAFARLAVFNQFTKGFATSFHTLGDGGTVTLDATLGNKFFLTIGGDRTLVINGAADGQEIEVWVEQDGTGGRALTWPTEVLHETGDGELSPQAGAIDRFQLTYNAAEDTFIARSALNAGANTTVATVTGSNGPIHVHTLLGSPSGAQNVTFTIEEGAVIISPDTATPALDFDGFDSSTVITLVNRGHILGHGGDGGMGARFYDVSDGQVNGHRGTAGRAGGSALRGPGTGCTFNIDNAGGFIWGGGGGGGGGGVSADAGSAGNIAAGGGGGGGAGGGRGGNAVGPQTGSGSVSPTEGAQGGTGPAGTFGAAGTGDETGTATGGDGGAGGDWGANGAAGTGPTAQGIDVAAGGAGTAGLAIDQNGGTANVTAGSGSPNVEGAIA